MSDNSISFNELTGVLIVFGTRQVGLYKSYDHPELGYVIEKNLGESMVPSKRVRSHAFGLISGCIKNHLDPCYLGGNGVVMCLLYAMTDNELSDLLELSSGKWKLCINSVIKVKD